MFDDNQVDPEALRVFLVSVASEDTSSADEEDDHDEEVRDDDSKDSSLGFWSTAVHRPF